MANVAVDAMVGVGEAAESRAMVFKTDSARDWDLAGKSCWADGVGRSVADDAVELEDKDNFSLRNASRFGGGGGGAVLSEGLSADSVADLDSGGRLLLCLGGPCHG